MNNIQPVTASFAALPQKPLQSVPENSASVPALSSADSFVSDSGKPASAIDLRRAAKMLVNSGRHPLKDMWKHDIPGNRNIPAVSTKSGDLLVSKGYDVTSLDGATGRMRWELNTGFLIDTAPVMGNDGTVFVGSRDGNIYAINDALGQILWEKPWNKPEQSIFPLFRETAPGALYDRLSTGPDGTVFGGTTTRLFAIDGKTGTMKWDRKVKEGVNLAPVTSSDGTVVTGVEKPSRNGSKDFYLIGLDGQTGEIKWQSNTHRDFARMASTIDREGNVYLCNREGIAVYDSRTGKWKADINDRAACDLIYPPEIDEKGTVYVSNQHTHSVTAYERDNSSSAYNTKWSFDQFGGGSVPPLITGDGTVIAGAMNGDIVILNQDNGALMGTCNVKSQIVTVPQKGADGTYFFDTTRTVCALRLDGDELDMSSLNPEDVVNNAGPCAEAPEICDDGEYVEIDGIRLDKKTYEYITVFPGLLR